MKLVLPPEFIQTIRGAFGGDGRRWLETLPDLLDEASRRWGLMDIQPFSNLSYNFVAFAKLSTESNVSRRWLQSQATYRDDKRLHSHVVLKLGVPNHELNSEIAALRLYNGRGACRLLEVDSHKGMLLLERLLPGRMLSTLEDDEQATRIAAEVMSQLWRHVPENRDDFIQLKDWFGGFKRLRQKFEGGTGPLPEKLVATAEALSRELLAENKDESLLHGDFHHFNVLESGRGWLAIDPKGVIGPKGYEVGPLLINPVPNFLNGSNPKIRTEKRIAILSEMLCMERERVRAWGICHAVLSAWWSIEDNDPGWGDYCVCCGELFTMVQI
jgi:streptomycin 6-kinase